LLLVFKAQLLVVGRTGRCADSAAREPVRRQNRVLFVPQPAAAMERSAVLAAAACGLGLARCFCSDPGSDSPEIGVAEILAARLPGWKDVTAATVVVTPFAGRVGIVKLSASTATANAELVFKRLYPPASARLRAVHQALSHAGVAPPLLASGSDWTAEAAGTRRDFSEGRGVEGRDWRWSDVEEALMCAQNAELTARLHAAPTSWWPLHREALRKLLPLLDDEPESSPLWIRAALCEAKGWAVPSTGAEQAQLAQLMSTLPRPMGELANRLVNIHGDLWEGNTVVTEDGVLKLMDFELTCVCGAAYDLVHTCGPVLVEVYIRAVTGRQPTKDECEALLLEVRVAEHIHFHILPPIFGDNRENIRMPAGNYIEHARRFAAVVTAVRSSKALRRYVVRGCVPEGQPAIMGHHEGEFCDGGQRVDQRELRPAQEARGAAWCWWTAEQLAVEVARHR